MNIGRWSIHPENDWTSFVGLHHGYIEWLQVRHIHTPDDFTVTVRLLGLGLSVTRWADSDWEAA